MTKISLVFILLLTLTAPSSLAKGAHKPGAGVYVAAPDVIRLDAGETLDVEVEFTNPNQTGRLSLKMTLPEGLASPSNSEWQFQGGEKPIIPLTLSADHNGRYYLTFTAESETQGLRVSSVTGVVVQVGEPPVSQQKASLPNEVQSLPAQETILHP